jgi:DNA-binding transcriptional LysR family regulator
MDLSQLKRFVVTVEGGSLGKAAAMLNISQPGLSKSIHQLEAEFGARLLDRGPKGVTPTALGEAVYLRAKRILAEWRHLENERVALCNGLVGHVTVGVARGTGFLGRVLPAASARLTNSRYSVHLTVVSGVGEELVRALRLGDLDFAIAVLDGVSGATDLIEDVLFYDRCGLFADPAHPLARSGPVTIEDLVNCCWLLSTDAASLRDALTSLALSKGVEPRKTVIDSNSVVYLVSTLIGSEFVGLLSMDSVEDAVNAGNLVELVIEPTQRSQLALAAVERPIGFLRRANTTLSPVARALRDEILALCIKLGYPLVAATAKGNGAGTRETGS